MQIGFIPLVDAAALIVAVDKGFAAEEGLDVTLVREVSWSNVRDKLNIGLFDAAHLLAPVAIASSLGLGHVKVPIVAPFNLGLNGNAITVSPALHAAIMAEIDGDRSIRWRPRRRWRAWSRRGARPAPNPLTFGMTFPFSTHNYQLRFWMAAGESIPTTTSAWWCCRRPTWSTASPAARSTPSASARPGIRSRSIGASAISCISSPTSWCARPRRCSPSGRAGRTRIRDVVAALVRAFQRAAEFIEQSAKSRRGRAPPELARRIGVDAELSCARSMAGSDFARWNDARKQPLSAGRPGRRRAADPVQAAWLYAQMVRWGQAAFTPGRLKRDGGVQAGSLRGRHWDRQREHRATLRRCLYRAGFDPPTSPAIWRVEVIRQGP